MIIKLSPEKNLYIMHKVSLLDISTTVRHISIMLKTGLELEDALRIAFKQTDDLKLLEVAKYILEDVRSGTSLSESMEKHSDVFTDIVISIINVGEQGGRLEENLLFLSEYLKKAYLLKRKIRGAMIYPMIIFAIAFVEVIGIIFFFLPRLSSLYDMLEEPPKFTVFVISSAAFVRENIIVILIVGAALFAFITFLLRTKKGKRFKEWLSLNVPVFSTLNKKNILLTFSRTLSLLLQSGIAIQEALKITKDTIGNSYYTEILNIVYEKAKGGKNISQALSKYPKYFPLTYTSMIEVSEETGTLEENLTYLYDFYSEEVEEMTDNLTTLLEPFMLIIVAILIIFLAISIIAPLYQLTGSLNAF